LILRRTSPRNLRSYHLKKEFSSPDTDPFRFKLKLVSFFFFFFVFFLCIKRFFFLLPPTTFWCLFVFVDRLWILIFRF
jgi:hypothetical protein